MSRKLLTEEQHNFLVKNIKGRYNQELTDLINQTFNLSLTKKQVKNYKSNHKLGFSGITGRYETGHIPFNKGTKGLINVGGNKTSFKRGQIPHNYKPVGYERVDKDGYISIKVSDVGSWNQRWKLKSHVIWEETYGPISKKEMLIYKDGNPNNCQLDNLELITKTENLQINRMQIKRNSSEITDTAVFLARIKLKAADIRKKMGKKNNTRFCQ